MPDAAPEGEDDALAVIVGELEVDSVAVADTVGDADRIKVAAPDALHVTDPD